MMSEDIDHDELRDSVSTMSDELEEKYDKIEKDLEEKEDEGVEVQDLEDRYRELKERVSDARKKGKDVFLANNLLLSFEGNLELYKASEDQEDRKKVENILNEAEREMEKAEERENVDVRSEVRERFQKIKEGEDEQDENSRQVEEESSQEQPFEDDESTKFEDGSELPKIEPDSDVEEDSDEVEDEELQVDVERVPENSDQYFHVKDGKDIESIKELIDYLPEMDHTTFRFYTYSRGVNDWAEWIENIFGEEELADKIRDVYRKDEMKKILEDAAK